MIAPPEVVETPAQTAAVIHLAVARNEMMKVFGPAVAELMSTLRAQGVEPVGAVFAHHLKFDPGVFDFELGVRIAKSITATGRVKPGELPAARVARTVYSGPYEGLPSAWSAFDTWIEANGHAKVGDLWEVYSVGPQAAADPSDWKTELNRPLAR